MNARTSKLLRPFIAVALVGCVSSAESTDTSPSAETVTPTTDPRRGWVEVTVPDGLAVYAPVLRVDGDVMQPGQRVEVYVGRHCIEVPRIGGGPMTSCLTVEPSKTSTFQLGAIRVKDSAPLAFGVTPYVKVEGPKCSFLSSCSPNHVVDTRGGQRVAIVLAGTYDSTQHRYAPAEGAAVTDPADQIGMVTQVTVRGGEVTEIGNDVPALSLNFRRNTPAAFPTIDGCAPTLDASLPAVPSFSLAPYTATTPVTLAANGDATIGIAPVTIGASTAQATSISVTVTVTGFARTLGSPTSSGTWSSSSSTVRLGRLDVDDITVLGTTTKVKGTFAAARQATDGSYAAIRCGTVSVFPTRAGVDVWPGHYRVVTIAPGNGPETVEIDIH